MKVDLGQETPRGNAAAHLLGTLMSDCLEQCSDEEATKLKLAMHPDLMSREVRELLHESLATIMHVAQTNAIALANVIVMGDEYDGYKLSDFDD